MGGSTVLQNNAHYLVMQWARVKVTPVLEKAQHGNQNQNPCRTNLENRELEFGGTSS
jgi:hypothetical protein